MKTIHIILSKKIRSNLQSAKNKITLLSIFIFYHKIWVIIKNPYKQGVLRNLIPIVNNVRTEIIEAGDIYVLYLSVKTIET